MFHHNVLWWRAPKLLLCYIFHFRFLFDRFFSNQDLLFVFVLLCINSVRSCACRLINLNNFIQINIIIIFNLLFASLRFRYLLISLKKDEMTKQPTKQWSELYDAIWWAGRVQCAEMIAYHRWNPSTKLWSLRRVLCCYYCWLADIVLRLFVVRFIHPLVTWIRHPRWTLASMISAELSAHHVDIWFHLRTSPFFHAFSSLTAMVAASIAMFAGAVAVVDDVGAFVGSGS